MSNVAIRVKNLSKRYRIGLREDKPETLVGAMASWFKSPISNYRQLQRLSRFADNGQEREDVIWALKDVSFEVEQGEVVGIIGRNGAGKSTLLKILSRITEPSSGRATINGRIASLLEVGTGFHPELTGRENVYLNGTVLGMSRQEVERKFDEIVDFSGVEKFIDTPIKRYSSGMQVRLAFAVAAHLEPEILLVDEVLAVGDAEFQKKCLGKMGEVARKGRTVLLVSHQMAAIQNLCRRAVLLDHGKLQAHGQTDSVITKYLNDSEIKSQISLHERRDREGTGAIRFVSVSLENGKGESIGKLRSGGNAVLILGIEPDHSQELRNLQIALGIDNQAGQRIAVLDNEITGEIFHTVPSTVTGIELHIERLPLPPGQYRFTVFGTVDGVIADWVKSAGSFEVVPGDFYGTGKLPPANQSSFLVSYKCQMRLPNHLTL